MWYLYLSLLYLIISPINPNPLTVISKDSEIISFLFYFYYLGSSCFPILIFLYYFLLLVLKRENNRIFRIARYKVYTDYVLEVYKVDLLVLGTPLSSLMLTNTRFLFDPNTWNQVVTFTIYYDKWQIQI